eukprot:jgi/Mesvir1/12612/Mv21123-RA.1
MREDNPGKPWHRDVVRLYTLELSAAVLCTFCFLQYLVRHAPSILRPVRQTFAELFFELGPARSMAAMDNDDFEEDVEFGLGGVEDAPPKDDKQAASPGKEGREGGDYHSDGADVFEDENEEDDAVDLYGDVEVGYNSGPGTDADIIPDRSPDADEVARGEDPSNSHTGLDEPRGETSTDDGGTRPAGGKSTLDDDSKKTSLRGHRDEGGDGVARDRPDSHGPDETWRDETSQQKRPSSPPAPPPQKDQQQRAVTEKANGPQPSDRHGQISLFVGELQWWTTDAELEKALSEFGKVKNLRFFEERVNAKSKGYAQCPDCAETHKELAAHGKHFPRAPFCSAKSARNRHSLLLGAETAMHEGPYSSPNAELYYTGWRSILGISHPQPLHSSVRDWTVTHGLQHGEEYWMAPQVQEDLQMGLSWESGCDVDASVALFDGAGACVDLVWYRHPRSACGSIVHSGDNLTGEKHGDDEAIHIMLGQLPKHIHRILCVASVFSSQFSFANVRCCKVRLLRKNRKQKPHVICEYSLSGQPCESMCMWVMVRRGEYWTLHALGLPTQGKTVEEVVKLPAQLGPVMAVPSQDPHYRRAWMVVVRGEDLAAKDVHFFGKNTSDPFYKAKFKGNKYTSEVVKKSLNPKWHEHSLPLGLITSVCKKALKITVWDEDLSSLMKEFMGAVYLPSSVIWAAGPGKHHWLAPLTPSKKPKYEDCKVSGKLLILMRVEDVPAGVYT